MIAAVAVLERFFERPELLLLLPVAVVVLAIMVWGDVVRRRATAALGDANLVDALVTWDAGPRRALKGALRVLALVAAIVALARPRTKGGEKIVPAADVRAIVALDVSKSMYAQDVAPSRLERARNDASRMIFALPQIRWGGVAFSGEALAYPPTTDARAAALFLGAHEPITMPGGTAIAKALELARQQLAPQEIDASERDKQREDARPKSAQRRVIVLITDGEDLEGDPVQVARMCHDDGIRIHVVAIGLRAPQPIPYVDPDSGVQNGLMRDDDGSLITTELSPQAEAQLKSIASETQGRYVRADDGTTGIALVEADLKSLIAKEGTERAETMWQQQYHIPLAFAVILLLADVAIGESKRRPVAPVRGSHAR